MNKKFALIMALTLIFLLGWVSNNVYGIYTDRSPILEQPGSIISDFLLDKPVELSSPSNHVTEDQINVYEDEIILDIANAQWTYFTDSNSMDPLLDAGANGIEIMPSTEDDIKIGDVIAYETDDGTIIHRVIDTGRDKEGTYYITKGDNNPVKDSEKVRFNQIKGLLIAIIY